MQDFPPVHSLLVPACLLCCALPCSAPSPAWCVLPPSLLCHHPRAALELHLVFSREQTLSTRLYLTQPFFFPSSLLTCLLFLSAVPIQSFISGLAFAFSINEFISSCCAYGYARVSHVTFCSFLNFISMQASPHLRTSSHFGWENTTKPPWRRVRPEISEAASAKGSPSQ